MANDKTEKALKPSRDSWFSRAMRLFDRTAIDEAVWDELEELLISADVGVATTEKLIERVKQRVKEDKLNEGAMVRSALKSEMVNMLNVEAKENTTIVKKYGAFTSSLFINTIRNSSEQIEEVKEIWLVLGKDEAFIEVVKSKIERSLKE